MPEQFSEQELIDRFKSGRDIQYLSQLFVPYIPLVYGVCLKYFKSSHDAEDAVNNVFELLLKRLPNHDVENFKSWLYVLTKNHCLEVLRSKNKKTPKESEAAIMYSEQVFHPDNIKDEELLNKLKNCVQALSEDQRVCVEHFYFKSYNYKKIASLLNISWNAVRSNIQNGRRMLKNCIENK